MPQPSSAVTRWEFGVSFNEFDLAMNRRKYVGPRVLRPRLTRQQSANVGKVEIEKLLLQRATARKARSTYGRDNWEFTNFSFATNEYGWESLVDDREAKIYRDIVDQESISTQRAINVVCDEYERDCAAAVFNTSTWTGAALTTAVGTAWSTWATAVPITDIVGAINKVNTNSGLDPNALVVNRAVFRDLCNTTQVVDRIRYAREATQSALRSAIADLLDIDYVIVAGGFTNTANEAATASISSIWGRYAMVCRIAETDDPREPCIGRTFMYESENAPDAAGSTDALAVIVEEYRDETTRGSVFRARNDRDVVIMYPEAGHLLSGV